MLNKLLEKTFKSVFLKYFKEMQLEFIDSLKLKDMTDDELINKFKHIKWGDADVFQRQYLASKYGFICSYWGFDVAPCFIKNQDYISDKIQQILVYKANLHKLVELKENKNKSKKKKKNNMEVTNA